MSRKLRCTVLEAHRQRCRLSSPVEQSGSGFSARDGGGTPRLPLMIAGLAPTATLHDTLSDPTRHLTSEVTVREVDVKTLSHCLAGAQSDSRKYNCVISYLNLTVTYALVSSPAGPQ